MSADAEKEADRIRKILGPGSRVEVQENENGIAINIVPEWHKGIIEVGGNEIAFELRKVTEKGYYNVKIGEWISGVSSVDELLTTIERLDKERREKPR